MKIKNILSVTTFIFSFTFFIVSTMLSESTITPNTGNCYHCGSFEACKNGGQPYGWTGCYINEGSQLPSEFCLPYGSPYCG